MNVDLYARLQVLAPILSGNWRWLGYVAVSLPLLLTLWALLAARWRPDGVRRCVFCGHTFAPDAEVTAQGIRCLECGKFVRSNQEALRRRGRRRVAVIGLTLTACASIPLLLWHSVPIFVARLVLPRWVARQRAEFPNGLILAEEIDPVQEWLHWEPNTAAGAWHGGFEEVSVVPILSTGQQLVQPVLVWPDRVRVRAWTAGHEGTWTVYLAPFAFGIEQKGPLILNQQMPSVGAPGFGGDITGDGVGDVIIGSINVGSGGGVNWMRVNLPASTGTELGVPTLDEFGSGIFRRDERHQDWLFMKVCHGFRYQLSPGAFSNDPLIACSWDQRVQAWLPNLERMRGSIDQEMIAAIATEAQAMYELCEAKYQSAIDNQSDELSKELLRRLRIGEPSAGTGYLPCPELVGVLARGVLEFVLKGHGDEWRAWIQVAWPAKASDEFRARFIAVMTRAINECECAETLRLLNGNP